VDRKKLNPTDPGSLETIGEKLFINNQLFARAFRYHARALAEERKLKERSKFTSLSWLHFIFEEYECRCFWFPIFELSRRIFLTSILAVIYPGRMQQVVVGLLATLFSCAMYQFFNPYIKDDDDIVAIVASVQLILIYVAAIAAYVADAADEKQAFYSGTAFGVVLIIILFLSFIVAVFYVLMEVFGYVALQDTIDNISKKSFWGFWHPTSSAQYQQNEQYEQTDSDLEMRPTDLLSNQSSFNNTPMIYPEDNDQIQEENESKTALECGSSVC